jgi:hypothetical protein
MYIYITPLIKAELMALDLRHAIFIPQSHARFCNAMWEVCIYIYGGCGMRFTKPKVFKVV